MALNLFESNLLLNITEFLDIPEVFKLERISRKAKAKLSSSNSLLQLLASRLVKCSLSDIAVSITFAQLKQIAKQTLVGTTKEPCDIQMIPYFSNAGSLPEYAKFGFWEICKPFKTCTGFCTKVESNALVKMVFLGEPLYSIFSKPLLMSLYYPFDAAKYKVQDDVFHVPLIPEKVEQRLKEKSCYLNLTGIKVASPRIDFTSPVCKCVVFTSMTDISDYELYSSPFNDVNDYNSVIRLANDLGLETHAPQSDGFTVVEFSGSVWPMRPICWVSYCQNVAEFNLKWVVPCKYISVLFIDSYKNSITRTTAKTMDILSLIPIGRIVALDQSLQLVHQIDYTEKQEAKQISVASQTSELRETFHSACISKARGVCQELLLSDEMEANLTDSQLQSDEDQTFSYSQLRLVLRKPKAYKTLSVKSTFLVIETDLCIASEVISLLKMALADPSGLGPHTESHSSFYDIIEFEPTQANTRAVALIKTNIEECFTSYYYEVTLDPLLKWHRSARTVFVILFDSRGQAFPQQIKSISILG